MAPIIRVPPPGGEGTPTPAPSIGINVGGNTGGSGSSGGSSGAAASGSDWQHLMVRFGEFIVGVVLIWVGIQAVVVKRPAAQTIIQTTGTVAKAVK